jgi:hypothetical protein
LYSRRCLNCDRFTFLPEKATFGKQKSTDNMGYPDTFEGFMVNSQKDWTTFKKQEVRQAVAYEYPLF